MINCSKEKGLPKVAVILAFYNGSRWVDEQLLSIETQDYPNIDVYIFDDASTSLEREILCRTIERYKCVVNCESNPQNLGFSKNFLIGLERIDTEYDYYAFSDQDDIWDKNKISRALKLLMTMSAGGKLYCSRTRIYDDRKKSVTGLSPLFGRRVGFGNSLVQSIAGGNTMVFNATLRDKVLRFSKNFNPISHDWLVYQVATGTGADVLYDPNPSLYYRQTDHNLVGSNNDLRAKGKRLIKLFQGEFKRWNDVHFFLLNENKGLLTDDARELLADLIRCRNDSLFRRVRFLFRARIWRQTWSGNLGLVVGFFLKKI